MKQKCFEIQIELIPFKTDMLHQPLSGEMSRSIRTDQLRSLLESLIGEYEKLSDVKSNLDHECAKLRDYMDEQTKKIRSLSHEMERLKEKCVEDENSKKENQLIYY